jgi:hypothetical protein
MIVHSPCGGFGEQMHKDINLKKDACIEWFKEMLPEVISRQREQY